MTAYYNEIDPAAAAWLRELIKAGHIAPGIVDESKCKGRVMRLRGYGNAIVAPQAQAFIEAVMQTD